MKFPAGGRTRLVLVGATGMVGGCALRSEDARHLAPEAETGFASGLRGLLRTRGPTLRSERSRGVYRGGDGYAAPQGNRRLNY